MHGPGLPHRLGHVVSGLKIESGQSNLPSRPIIWRTQSVVWLNMQRSVGRCDWGMRALRMLFAFNILRWWKAGNLIIKVQNPFSPHHFCFFLFAMQSSLSFASSITLTSAVPYSPKYRAILQHAKPKPLLLAFAIFTPSFTDHWSDPRRRIWDLHGSPSYSISVAGLDAMAFSTKE